MRQDEQVFKRFGWVQERDQIIERVFEFRDCVCDYFCSQRFSLPYLFVFSLTVAGPMAATYGWPAR